MLFYGVIANIDNWSAGAITDGIFGNLHISLAQANRTLAMT